MMMAAMGMRSQRSLVAAAAAVAALLCLSYLYMSPREFVRQHVPGISPWRDQQPQQSGQPERPQKDDASPPPRLQLPDDYSYDDADSDYCRNRFTTKYLTDLRDTTYEYCTPSSQSRIRCFHSHTASDNERDSLCIAKNAQFDNGKFVLRCHMNQPDDNATARGIIPFGAIRQYWYETGPRYLFDNYVRFDPETVTPEVVPRGNASSDERRFTLLLKREGEGNPWHCLMEIWSMAMTIDVLRMTADPEDSQGRPFFRVPEDLANMQVVILDERADGPYFDLWTLFSGRTPIRDYQISGNPEAQAFLTGAPQRVIVPLAGASNPTWQNDWRARDCTRSDTMRAFVHRVLDHYHVSTPAPPSPEDANANANANANAIRLTFVDRKGAATRNLRNMTALLAAVKTRYPDVQIEAVDFGALSFAEQLAVARQTDILVGIHGAGLTHTLFMRERVTAVVELQPADMKGTYMGFRNMANMRGIGYFRAHARPILEEEGDGQSEHKNEQRDDLVGGPAQLLKRASWHRENFEMNEDAFVEVVGAAIKSLYSKSLRDHDVV